MINKEDIAKFVADFLKDSEYFPVDVTVSASNEIVVEFDGPDGVDIDHCVALSRAIEQAFPRDEEDYELEVGGAGLTSPFKVPAQYIKNVGNSIELLTRDGRKFKADLRAADDKGITIATQVKTRVEGQKKPVLVEQTEQLPYEAIKKATRVLDF